MYTYRYIYTQIQICIKIYDYNGESGMFYTMFYTKKFISNWTYPYNFTVISMKIGVNYHGALMLIDFLCIQAFTGI